MSKELYYNSNNFLYESIKNNIINLRSINESSINLETGILSVMNIFFHILLNSNEENIKSQNGFKEIKDKILNTRNYSSFKQYLISIIKKLSINDSIQKEEYNKNIQILSELLSKFDTELGTNEKVFISFRNEFISNILDDFEKTLKDREEEFKKSNLKFSNQTIKEEYNVIQENEDEEEVFKKVDINKIFNLSRQALDAAFSFHEEVLRDKNLSKLKDNIEINKYLTQSEEFLKQAKDMIIIDKKKLGVIIVTPSGEYKRKKYFLKQSSLINDIIRHRQEYLKTKESILKTSLGASTPICPKGQYWDELKKKCIIKDIKLSNINKKEKVSIKNCNFPIYINKNKCKEVEEIQKKIMFIFPVFKGYLNKHGGVDGIYGKATASSVNIIWANIQKDSSVNLYSPLTKEKYDKIMSMQKEEIKINKENVEKSIENKEIIIQGDENKKEDNVGMNTSSKEKSIEKESEEKTKGETKDETKTEKKRMITREEWRGLKYVQTGTYAVSFDESLLSAWGKELATTAVSFLLPGSGMLLKAGTTGLKSLGTRFLSKRIGIDYLSRLATKMGLKKAVVPTEKDSLANILSKLSIEYFNKYNKIAIPRRLESGVIGGTLGRGVIDFLSGRNSFTIEVVNGYIDYTVVNAIKNGLIDTLDGYVSDDDYACIANVLAIIKGAWTIDQNDKPVSVWKVLKEKYKRDEGEDLISDIRSVKAKIGDVEGFPYFKYSNPQRKLQDVDWNFAKELLEDFVNKLERNESKLEKNLKDIPPAYINALMAGDFVEFDEEGNIEGENKEENREENEEKNEDIL